MRFLTAGGPHSVTVLLLFTFAPHWLSGRADRLGSSSSTVGTCLSFCLFSPAGQIWLQCFYFLHAPFTVCPVGPANLVPALVPLARASRFFCSVRPAKFGYSASTCLHAPLTFCLDGPAKLVPAIIPFACAFSFFIQSGRPNLVTVPVPFTRALDFLFALAG